MDTKDLDRILADQRRYFLSGATLPVEFRVAMLKKLHSAVRAHEADIADALTADLGKSDYEGFMCETGLVLSELSYLIRRTPRLARPRRVPTPLAQFAAYSPIICFLLPHLGQGRLDIGGGGANKGHDAHPENRAGPSEQDRAGRSGDVACTHPAADSDGEGLERRHAGARFFLGKGTAEHLFEQPDLRAFENNGKQQTAYEGKDDEREPPHKIVNGSNEFRNGHPTIHPLSHDFNFLI